MTRVMIAVDGSEFDRPLAARAHELFGDGAQYWAVNVGNRAPVGAVPTTFPAMYGGSFIGFGTAYPYLAPDPHEVYEVRDDAGNPVDPVVERADATARQAMDEAGVPDAETVAEVGDPPEAILRAAHAHGADVIVVGDHDRSWWSRLIDPPMSGELLDLAEIPVLVMPAAMVAEAESADSGPER